MELNRWKLMAGGAALIGVAAGGVTAATADDGIDLNDRRGEIVLIQADTATGADFTALDDSPESADSPNESVEESADSPFDSPDDAEFVAPASAPTPAPTPAPDPAAAGSADSGGSAGSPDIGGSGDS